MFYGVSKLMQDRYRYVPPGRAGSGPAASRSARVAEGDRPAAKRKAAHDDAAEPAAPLAAGSRGDADRDGGR